jgi:hypothetical protein
MAKQIILDRMTAKLLTAGLLDIFMGKHGILRRDRLEQKILEAEPIVATWLSINNAILRDLEALGLERKPLDITLTPAELADAIMSDKRDLEAKKRSESPVEARSPEGTPDSLNGKDDTPGGENESN